MYQHFFLVESTPSFCWSDGNAGSSVQIPDVYIAGEHHHFSISNCPFEHIFCLGERMKIAASQWTWRNDDVFFRNFPMDSSEESLGVNPRWKLAGDHDPQWPFEKVTFRHQQNSSKPHVFVAGFINGNRSKNDLNVPICILLYFLFVTSEYWPTFF